MQNLAAALEQILVRRVLNKRVLEAIVGVRRRPAPAGCQLRPVVPAPSAIAPPPSRPPRVRAGTRSRARLRRRAAPRRVLGRDGRAAPSAIVAGSAGSPECHPARRAPTEAGLLP